MEIICILFFGLIIFLFYINKHTNNEKQLIFSQEFLRDLVSNAENTLENPDTYLISFDEKEILFEDQVCTILGTTPRTLRNYRKKEYIRAISFKGRIIYLKTFLWLDLLKMFYEQNKR